jgi:hypothetical protein
MPCMDGGPSAHEVKMRDQAAAAAKRQTQMIEASLCAIVSAIDKQSIEIRQAVFGSVDWQEAGVTVREFDNWLHNHRAKDAERRKAEEEAKARAALLARLTDEEKRLLGVK